jgi:hypothetical protein
MTVRLQVDVDSHKPCLLNSAAFRAFFRRRALAAHCSVVSLPPIQEALVSPLQELWIRTLIDPAWKLDTLRVHPLQSVPQHRAVLLDQHVSSHFDDVVGTHRNEVLIEGRVMQLAQRDAV